MDVLLLEEKDFNYLGHGTGWEFLFNLSISDDTGNSECIMPDRRNSEL